MSRLSSNWSRKIGTLLAFAGVLILGSAALSTCYGGTVLGGPPPTTTTTIPQLGGPLSVFPMFGGPATPVTVSSSGCFGTSPHVTIGFYDGQPPGTLLSGAGAVIDASGNWRGSVEVPANVVDGGAYSITATCTDTSTTPPTLLYTYGPVGFTGAKPGCPPTC
jgi:hypothetical protein